MFLSGDVMTEMEVDIQVVWVNSRLKACGSWVEILDYLSTIDREFLSKIEEHTTWKNSATTAQINSGSAFNERGLRLSNQHFMSHSSKVPVYADRHYCLFGYQLSQSEWFRVLGFTEEEQVAHYLRWGRHD